MDTAGDLLSLYTNGLKSEQQWGDHTQLAIDTQPPLTQELPQLKQMIEPTMTIYNGLGERQHQIEAVNRHGGQYIREAKIYDRKLKQYRDSLEDIDAALVEGLSKRRRHEGGAETVKTELDMLNRRYIDMVKWTNNRLKEITARLSGSNEDIQFQMVIDEDIPLLRTFRAELAKRSSMLVDEDMQGFFEQLSEFEGYASQPGQGYSGPAKTFVSKVTMHAQSTHEQPPATLTPGIRVTKMMDTMEKPVTAAVVPQVQMRMVSPPPSDAGKRLSQKVASITSITALGNVSEIDGKFPQASQTLVTLKLENLAPKGTTVFVSAILNPKTGRKLNMVEAIKTGLFDPKTGYFMDPITSRRIQFLEACDRGYISSELQRELKSPCGIPDPRTGRQLSLMDAIQKGYFDPVKLTFRDPSTGLHIPVHEALSRGIISDETAKKLCGDGYAVTTITQSQAIFGDRKLSSLETTIGLAEAVEKGLYDHSTGKILDPLSGNHMTILEAVEKGFISPSKKEIKDPSSGEYVTLIEAVSKGLIDPESGQCIEKTTGKRIPLDEAFQQQILNKPLTLSKALADGTITDKGYFVDPQSGKVMAFSDAVDNGLLDDSVKCIVDPTNNDVLSLSEAIERGVIDSRGLYVPPGAAPPTPIGQALEEGHIKLVSEEVVFAKPSVKDSLTGKTLTLAEALKQGVITSGGEFVDTRSGRRVLLRAAGSQGFVVKDTVEKLTQETSIKDLSGKNVTMLKAVQMGLISPTTGEIRNLATGDVMPLQQATMEGLLSAEDAQTVIELLSPVVIYTALTTNQKSVKDKEEPPMEPITVSEALDQGLLDEDSQTFRHPRTGKTMPVEDAIEQGLLKLSSEWPRPTLVSETKDDADRWLEEVVTKMSPVSPGQSATVDSKLTKDDEGFSFTTTTISRPAITENLVSETNYIKIQSVTDPRTKERLSPQEAATRGLINVAQGCFIHPATGKKFTVKEAMDRGFLTGMEVDTPTDQAVKAVRSFSITGVIDPNTGDKISVSQAVKDGILDRERGQYVSRDGLGREVLLPISQAVEKGLVLADDVSVSPAAPLQGLKRETRSYQLKSVKHPITGKNISVLDAVQEGILDEHNGVYINTSTGEKLRIPEAIEQKLIDAELSSITSSDGVDGSKVVTTKLTTLKVSWVVDPRTSATISVAKAVEEGIVNQHNGTYINIVTGEVMSMNDAIEKKLAIATASGVESSGSSDIHSIHITEELEAMEATLVEDITAETVTLSISSVVDPITMEMLSYDDAVISGVLDLNKGLYVNPRSGEVIPINSALNKGLIHADVTGQKVEEDIFHSSVQAGSGGFSLKHVASIRDAKTGLEMSPFKAVQQGLIDIEKGTFLDTKTCMRIPLEDAFKQGFFSMSKATDADEITRLMNESQEEVSPPVISENGFTPNVVEMKLERSGMQDSDKQKSDVADEILNYTTDVEQSFEMDTEDFPDSHRNGQLTLGTKQTTKMGADVRGVNVNTVAFPQGLSYCEAVNVGLVDPTSGKVRDPRSGNLISLQEAMEQGIINPLKPAMVSIVGNNTLTLQDAFKQGLVDPGTGRVNYQKSKTDQFQISPNLPTQFSSPGPLNLLDALKAGLYNPASQKFLEPLSGDTMSIQEAVNRNVLNGNMVTVKDMSSGRRISLKLALSKGLIDGATATVTDTATGEVMSLEEAVKRGLIQNSVNEEEGTVYDTVTGEGIPLNKAITDGQLRAEDVTILDTTTGEMVSMDVAFRKGLIDRRTGSVKDKQTGQKMTAQEAVKLGLMAVVGAPVLAGKAVFDAVKGRKGQTWTEDTSHTGQTWKMDVSPTRDTFQKRTLSSSSSSPQRSPVKDPSDRFGSPTKDKDHSPVKDTKDRYGSPIKVQDKSPMRDNGFSVNGNGLHDDDIQQPLTTIVYAKPTDRIKVSQPQRQTDRLDSPDDRSPSPAYGFMVSEDQEKKTDSSSVYKQRDETDVSASLTSHGDISSSLWGPQSVSSVSLSSLSSPSTSNAPDVVTRPSQQLHGADPQGPFISGTRVFVKSSDPPSADKVPTPPLSPITVQYSTSSVMTKDDLTVDWTAGKVIISKTGEVMNVPEAVQRGLLDSDTVEKLAEKAALESKTPEIDINWEDGTITVRDTQEKISLMEAKSRGYLDLQTSMTLKTVIEKMEEITTEETKQIVPVIVKKPIGTKVQETTVVRKTKKVVEGNEPPEYVSPDAMVEGFLSLNDIIRVEKNVTDSGSIFVQGYNYPISVRRAIDEHLIDIDSSCIVDPQTGKLLNLNEAIRMKVFDPLTGKLTHLGTGETITLKEAFLEGLIPQPGYSVTFHTETETDVGEQLSTSLSLLEAVEHHLVDQNSGTYTHPQTGEIMSLAAAIQYGYIDSVDSHHNVKWSESHVDRKEEKIIEETRVQLKPIALKPSTLKTFSTAPSVQETTQFAKTAQIEETRSFTEAMQVEQNMTESRFDTRTDSQFDSSTSSVHRLDALRDQLMNTSQQDRVVQEVQQVSLSSAIEMGYFSEESGMFTEPRTRQEMTLDEAIKRGHIDGNSLMVDIKTDERLTLQEGIQTGRIDPIQGKVVDKDSQSKFSLKDAAKFGLLAVAGAPALAIMKATGSLGRKTKKEKSPTYDSSSAVEPISPTTEIPIKKTPPKPLPKPVDISKGVPVNLQSTTVNVVSPTTLEIKDTIHAQHFDSLPRKKDVKTESVEKVTRKVNVEGVRDSAAGVEVPLTTALDRGIINQQEGTYTNSLTGQTFTLTEALDLGYIQGKVVDTISTKEQTTKEGFQADVTFHEKKRLSIVAVTDSLTGEKLSLPEAVVRGIVDKEGRTYYHKETGKRIPILDAVQEHLVVARDVDSQMKTDETFQTSKQDIITQTKSLKVHTVVDPATQERMSLPEAVRKDVLDLKVGILKNVRTGEEIPLSEGLRQGLVQGDDVAGFTSIKGSEVYEQTAETLHLKSAFDSETGQFIPIKLAIEKGIIDSHYGKFRKPNGEIIPVSKAVKEGLIKAESKRPMSPMSPRTTGVTFEKKSVNIQSVHDPVSGQDIPVVDAVDRGILNLQTGVFFNCRTGERMSIPEAIAKGSIKAESYPSEIGPMGTTFTVDVGSKSLTLLSVTDPRTGEKMPVSKAQRRGLVSDDLKTYHDPSGPVMDISDAVKQGLVEAGTQEAIPVLTSVTRESVTVQCLIDPVTQTEIPVHVAIQKGLFEPERGLVTNLRTGDKMSVEDGVRKGLVKVDSSKVKEKTDDLVVIKDVIVTKVKDPMTGRDLKVKEAVRKGILDKDKGLYYDPHTGASMPIEEALKSHLVEGSHMSQSQLVDKKTKDMKQINITMVLDPESGREISVNEAIERGIVDQDMTTYYDRKLGKSIKMEDAFQNGQVSGVVQTITTTQTKVKSNRPGSTYNIRSVMDTASGKMLNVADAVNRGILDEKGNFVDTSKGEVIPVSKAMKKGLVSADEVVATSPGSKTDHRGVRLRDALRYGYIDIPTGIYTEPTKGKMYTIDEAIRNGHLTADDKRPYRYSGPKYDNTTHSFQHALQTGLLDPKTAMFDEKLSGKYLSVEEALKHRYLSPIAGRVGGQGDSVIILKGAEVSPVMSEGILYTDFVDPKTGEEIDTKEATKRGLVSVVSVQQPITVSDAIRTGLVDSDTGVYHDPKSGDKLSVDEAVICGFLNMDKPEILEDVHLPHSEELPVSLTEAIRKGALNVTNAEFTEPHTQQTVSLQKAIQLGYLQPKLTSNDDIDDVTNDSSGSSKTDDSFDGKTEDSMDGKTDNSVIDDLPREVEAEKYTVVLEGSPFSPKVGVVVDQDGGVVSRTATEVQIKTGTAVYVTKPGFIVESSGRVRNTSTGDVMTFQEAVDAGLVEAESVEGSSEVQVTGGTIPPGLEGDSSSGSSLTTSLTTSDGGRLVDSYDKLAQDLNNELNWLSDVEQLLRDDQPINDEASKVQGQLDAQKTLHDDIQKHQQPILSLVYQTEQLLENHQEELTPEQVTEVQQLVSSLKATFGKVQKTADGRVKHLTTACNEVTKFEEEMTKFSDWLRETKNDLTTHQREVTNLDRLKEIKEHQKDMMNDMISHQADIRFMSMAVQKYMEEAKLHKLEVDAFKANRRKTNRLSWLGMEGMEAEQVGDKLKAATTSYEDLKSKCALFGEKLGTLSTKQRNFNESTFKLLTWLTDVEEKLSTSKQESATTEPEVLRQQLGLMRSASSDAISHGVQLDDLEKLSHDLIDMLKDLAVDEDHVHKLEDIIDDISGRHKEVLNEVNERSNSLQMALTKSQDVEDALDNLLSWVRDTDKTLTTQKPVSLMRDRLSEQYQELKTISADVESHKPSLDSVRHEANELIKTCELDMAKSLESKLGDLANKFGGVQSKCKARAKDIEEISETLGHFQDTLEHCNVWLNAKIENLEDKNWNKKSGDEMKDKVDGMTIEKKRKEEIVDELKQLGQALVEDPRTGEVSELKEKVTELCREWEDFNGLLSEREQEASEKERQSDEYSNTKKSVVDWLTTMEGKVDAFEPVAVDVEVAATQIEELQPMLQNYQDYVDTIDEVNDLGCAFDALQNADQRPSSPFRKIMRGRRLPSLMSPRLRSPSPTFPPPSPTTMLSPMSSESGISSKKSSSDNLLVEDLTEIQQELVDINQRYDLLGERLADRHHELQSMLDSMRIFLQDLNDLMTWVDLKDLDVHLAAPLPTSEREAKKKLKDHEEFHKELLDKEGLVEEIRAKAQDLMKTKKGIPGTDVVQQQLAELEDKWLDVKVESEHRRKSLDDMVTDLRAFKDAGVHLQKWVAQKEKMVGVLGPVATSPALIQNQQQQVKFLQEEIHGQESLYETFIRSGHSILDKCEPDCKESSHISQKMDVISKGWDRIGSRLRDRAQNLTAVEGLSGELDLTLQTVGDWIADFSTRLEKIEPGAVSPMEHRAQMDFIQSLEAEVVKQKPMVEKAKELSKKVAENTKDPSTKAELKNKLAAVEKPLQEIEKKLACKKLEIEQASEEGQNFQAACTDMLDWLADNKERLKEQPPISGSDGILKEQALQQSLTAKDISEHLPEFKDILKKAQQLLDTQTPSEHTEELANRVQAIKADWEELNKLANQRGQQIDASVKHATTFQDQMDNMLVWLQMKEDRLKDSSSVSMDRDGLAKKLKDAQSLQADMLKKSHDHDIINKEGQALINVVDADQDHVAKNLEDVNRRWKDLDGGVASRVAELEDLTQKLDEFHDNLRDVESSMQKCEDRLEAHNKQGSSARDPKHVDKMKAMQEDVELMTPQLDYVEALLDGFNLDSDSCSTRPLADDVEKVKDRHESLHNEITSLLSDLEAGSQVVSEYQDELQKAAVELSASENFFANLEPISRDESALTGQHRDMEEYLSKLGEMKDKCENLEKQKKNLEGSGYITDSAAGGSPLRSLQKQLDGLKDRAKQRQDEVDSVANKIETVADNLRRTRTSLDRAASELDMHEPIGTDLKAIKRQQEELKMFQKSVSEPQQKRVDTVLAAAQELIQSAAPGVSTSNLEADLEIMTDKSSELNEKVSERERSLDNALIHAGKFNDALDSLLSWLKETEEMVANQKAPSPDYKVIKAQLQEQKFLLKMLDDREPSVKSAKQVGTNLQKNVDPREQKGIQNQIAQLQQRYDTLKHNAGNRLDTLEQVVTLAKEFQETQDPLASWLDTMEKKFASLEPSAMDTEGIENIVSSLLDMEKEIQDRDEQVRILALRGKDLQNHCKPSEVKVIQKKIDDVQGRYLELKNKVTDSAEQMEEALPMATNFNEAHAKFIDWVVKIEPKLRAKEATGPEAEEQVQGFIDKLLEIQPILEVLSNDGNQLAELAPGDAGLKVEDMMNKDLKRFDAVNEQIQKRSQKLHSSKQRSSEIVGDMNNLLEWFEEQGKKIINAAPVSSDPDTLATQVADQKVINEDIASRKGKARDLITRGRKLLRESSLEDDPRLRERVETLKQAVDAITKLGTDRLCLLEQAQPLAKHFTATHQDLLDWFSEAEPALRELEVMSIDVDEVKKQQDSIKVLKQDVQDHKPVIDRLNKTGNALLKICADKDGVEVQAILDDDNKRLDNIRNSMKDRSLSIDEALQQSAEFTDKLEDMLENLTSTSEQVQHAEAIAAHPEKIREQISENKAMMDDMDMRQSALRSVKSTAEELIKQASSDQDEAVQDVQQKLAELIQLFNDIKGTTQNRSLALEDTLEVSEKFWDDIHHLTGAMKDLQDNINSQEPPALEPAIIREQQDFLEAIKEEIEDSKGELEEVRQTGDQLMTLCGEPDRPEVKKNIDDLNTNMSEIEAECNKRSKTLEDALNKAVHFQDELMKLLVWLQKREVCMREMGKVGSDFETIKVQWNAVKVFKAEVEPKQVAIESLNQNGNDMVKESSSSDQALVVKEPLTTVNKRWDGLLEGIADRQRKLQLAMLDAGQFEHALNELLAWLDKTEQTLDETQLSFGDPKHIEIELSKLKVVQNDIDAHKESVDSVKEAGARVAATEKSSDTPIKRKLSEANGTWGRVKDKCDKKYAELKDSLREAKQFTGELQDLLVLLGDLEGNLITTTPVGGLPETAREQLDRFMSMFEELERTKPRVDKVKEDGNNLRGKCSEPAASNIQQNLGLLQQHWDHIGSRATDRKRKLEDAVGQANNFHADLNKFIAWLTGTERTLNNLNPVSRLLERVAVQIEDHKVLQKDVSRNREVMIALDKTGTHLKYFSQKQDVILIKNLLSSVQHRWEKIVSRSAERTRHLERGFKEAKQFHTIWKELLDWMRDALQTLASNQLVGNDPVTIKAQIAKHKDFQRSLGTHQPLYDSVNRGGRALKDKCPPDDVPEIQKMLTELKAQWNNLCGKSVDRQRKLEEALLFSGQFTEALQALLDWLGKVEPMLGEDQPVHGDIDTVNNLLEAHKAFQQELGARSNTIAFVRKRAMELMDKSEGDMSQQQAELIELSTSWDRVCKLSVNKQERLEQAHKLAEDFHKKGQSLMDWLASAERQLRYRGPIPDEEAPLLKQIEEHKRFEEDLLRQEANLRETLNIGQDIMKRCHPDAVSTLKHWLSVLRARWEELTGMCKQRGRKLAEGLAVLRRNNALLDELVAWLNGAEGTLTGLDQEPIPGDLQVIQDLLQDHQHFQNEMSGKQPEIDKLTKGDRRRTSSVSGESHIPILKGQSGRHTPVKSRTPRKSDADGRRTPEPSWKNPRIGALFNKWRTVWLMAMDRHRKLQDALDYLNEVERLKKFEFEDWRRRYMQWMRHNKSRIMEQFRRYDRDRDGRVTRAEFTNCIMATKFPTTQLEMELVANLFDRAGLGLIDYKEFVSALRPADREPQKTITDAEKIMDAVKNQVSKCTCVKQFKIHKIGEGKYRFGDSQKLRLVRILRSTVMVRVGGGWVALDEFLVKNDPCRGRYSPVMICLSFKTLSVDNICRRQR
ncbi:Dystonin [Mizuhopecten yessoensis]|uniref:Dystonin n=1 Tax=Mizuhopecten yessoensis TaxID=6573 RepID=A0A210PEK3_MIZYE|nr:Dystonin [Mizuhopecten yessoensis]